MIIDSIENIDLYANLSPRLGRALAVLRERFAAGKLPPGRHEIDGDDLFAMVNKYDSLPAEGAEWEAHRKYIDIQYIVSGRERIGHADVSEFSVSKPYDAEKDVMMLRGGGDFATLSPGRFAILFPHEAHLPGRFVEKPEAVHKIVLKVRA